jgi:hypothetical protein
MDLKNKDSKIGRLKDWKIKNSKMEDLKIGIPKRRDED